MRYRERWRSGRLNNEFCFLSYFHSFCSVCALVSSIWQLQCMKTYQVIVEVFTITGELT